MSLTFVPGKPGSGKTHFCISEILKKQHDSHGRMIIYVVPEQFSLQSEKALVKQSQGGGLLAASVLSFNRLAYVVLTERGTPAKSILEETGKNMLVRRILAELKNDLQFYTAAHDKQGFVDEVCAQISEFSKYLITPELLRDTINAVREGQNEGLVNREALAMKLTDLHRIFDRYTEYRRTNYISDDETLDLLAAEIGNSKKLADADIFIDGYKSFTPQEYKVIEALLKTAANVYVALTTANDGGEFFSETRATADKLKRIAEDCGVAVNADIVPNSASKHIAAPELAYLTKYYYVRRAVPFAQKSENVLLCTADNMEAEIHNAASLIMSLCRERGYLYSEIAVVASALSDYSKLLRAVFRQYSIPFFVDLPDDILSHPLIEWVRALISIPVTNWQYESVFRFLKTHLTPLKTDNIDVLENYVLQHGIKGFRWKKPFLYGFSGNDEYGAYLNRLREAVIGIVEPFEQQFAGRGKKTYSIRAFCEAVYSTIIRNEIPERITGVYDRLNADNDIEQAAQYVLVWDKLVGVLDKMVEILGDERVTLREFAKILDAGLSAEQMGVAPPSLDQVVIGDLRRSRFGDIKALIVLGANDGMLPGRTDETGLFSDEERIFLESTGIELAPTSTQRAYEEQFLIYCALTKPSEFLAVSYFKGALDGKAFAPSSIISKLRHLLPHAKTVTAGEQAGVEGLAAAKPVFNGISGIMRTYARGGLPDIYKDVIGYFRNDADYADKIAVLESLIENKNPQIRLSELTVRNLYKKTLKASVSKLEKYVECPFSYFLRYNLDARERKLYELAGVDLGNIFHSALNRFAGELKARGKEWRNIDEGTLMEMADACVDGTLAEPENDIFRSSGQYAYFGERVRDITKRSLWALNEHMNRGGFTLSYSEAVFSDGDVDGVNFGVIRIPLKEGDMRLEGRIDRIDMLDLDGNKFVKVMDYKSGNKEFHFAEAFYGLQLQLTLYLDAFLKKCVAEYGQEYADKIFPGAMLYFTLANPLITLNREMGDDELYAAVLREYKMSGVILKDKGVIKSLDNEIGKSSDIIPVSMVKGASGGNDFDNMEFSKRASVLSADAFFKLMDYSVKKAEEIGNDILSGKIDVSPYSFKQSTGCRFCPYKPICRYEGSGSRLAKLDDTQAVALITGAGLPLQTTLQGDVPVSS